MKLMSLETHGFKKLSNFSCKFTDGLNVIVGDNAAGKSTLLQAIECALYGATVVPGKKENIFSWGAKSWLTRLFFELEGELYEVYRTKSTAKLRRMVDGTTDGQAELVANGNTPVTKWVEEALGLNAKDYNLFIQSKQGETSGVLTFGATSLSRKVEEFSGISLIDSVQDLAKEEHRNAKADASAKWVDPEEIASSENDIVELNDSVHAQGVMAQEAQEALDNIADPDSLPRPEADPSEMQKRITASVRLQSEVSSAREAEEYAEESLRAARARFEDMAEPESTDMLESRQKALKKDVKAASDERSEIQKELDRQVSEWNKMEKAQKQLEGMRSESDIQGDVDKETSHNTDLSDSLEKAHQSHIEVGYKVQQLADLKDGASCPTCGSQLSEHDPEKLEAEYQQLVKGKQSCLEKREEAGIAVEASNTRLRNLEEEANGRRHTEQVFEECKEDLKEAGVDLDTATSPTEDKLKEASNRYEQLVAERSQVAKQLSESEEAWRKYEASENEVARFQRQLSAKAKERQEDEVNLEEAKAAGIPSEDDVENAKAEWDEYHRRHKDLLERKAEAENNRNSQQALLNSLKEQLSSMENECQRLVESKKASEESEKVADRAGRLSRFLGERRSDYLQEVWDAVLGAASKQVAMASNGMVTHLAYKDGEFMFEEEGVLAPVASASGAQKAHIGVALRVGLSRALYGSGSLLIFDEPTESMREHHAQGLTASLAGASNQCLLITHREQDQDLAANVVEVAA